MESALKNGIKHYAFETESSEGFVCACCNQSVFLKKGMIKRAHFSHKNLGKCLFSENESEEHIKIKHAIFNSLKTFSFIKNLEMEKYLNNCVADIYFEKNNIKYAVEIQLSIQTREKMIERTEKYNKKDIHVIWIHSYEQFLNRIDLEDKSVSLKDWEKWLTAMNYGFLYLWKTGEKIIPVNFEKINKTDGFNFKSKRKIKSHGLKSLAMDFFGVKKDKFNDFPEAKILNFKK